MYRPGEKIGAEWPEKLMNFCKDIAHGMEYLSRKAFVHRDLAARNILLSKSMICKVGHAPCIHFIKHNP